jgi:hypothetical protein
MFGTPFGITHLQEKCVENEWTKNPSYTCVLKKLTPKDAYNRKTSVYEGAGLLALKRT